MVGRRAGWKRLLVVWVKIMLYCGLILSPAMRFNVLTVKASPGTTAVFSALAYDGYLQNSSSTWADAWAGVSGTVYNDTTGIVVGDWIFFGTHYLRRGFLFFDTSSLPDDAVIESWWISINVTGVTGTGFNLIVVNGQPTYPHTPLDSYDFNKDYYSVSTTSNCTVSADTLTQNVYNNFTASTEGSWISLTGYTKLCIRTDFDINNQDPGASKYVTFRAYETDADDPYSPAKLYVTYITPPQPSNIGYTKRYLAEETTFHVYWTGTNLNGYIFGWNATGTWQNDTYVSFSGSPNNAWSNVTKELPPKRGITIVWRVWCNDTNGWGDTGEQTLVTVKREYTEVETLQIIDSDIDTSTPNDNLWELVLQDTSFLGYDEWVTQYFTANRRLCRWIKLSDIRVESPFGYLYGRELEVYNYDSATWISPQTVYTVCGEDSSYPASNFIDGSTTSEWRHSVGEFHWIIVELNQSYRISAIRVYVGTTTFHNWTSVDIYLGMSSQWQTEGVKPWINATDYPSNYIWTDENNREIGNFTFENTTMPTILEVRLVTNITCDYDVEVKFWNGSGWQTATEKLLDTDNQWMLRNVTLNRLWWSYIYLNQIKIKFRSTTATTSSPVKIDHAYLWVKGYKTQDKMLQYLFDTSIVARMANDSFPLVKVYQANYEAWTGDFGEDLLSGALLYKLTNNSTYLSYAELYAEWLKTQPVCRLFQMFDDATGWTALSGRRAAEELLKLAVLTSINNSYQPLLKKAINNFTAIYLKIPEYRIVDSLIDGTATKDYLYIDNTAWSIAALAYSGYILGNQTIIDMAIRVALNHTLGNINVPYHAIYLNGTARDAGCKEDQTFGQYLLALETLYYYSGNETIKQRIQTLAKAAQYFYDSTHKRFYYVISADTGEVTNSISVHGFGYIEEALIIAYLIWGNVTWLDWAIDDFETMAIKGAILKNDLISHHTNFNYTPPLPGGESNDYWNAHAKRVAIIYYNLNYSRVYRNVTFLKTYNKLYGATSVGHYRETNLGWLSSVNPVNYSIWDWWVVPLSTIFKNFINITDVTINTFTELYASFGNPFTGEVFSNPLSTNIGTNTTTSGATCNFHTLWTDMDGLDTATFYWNASGTMQPNGTIQLTGTEVWSNFTRALPNQGGITIAWYIVANDTLGNWGNTTVQYLTLAQFVTKVFQEEIGASDRANSHGTVLVSEAVVSFDSVTKFIGKLHVEAVTFAVTVSKHTRILLQSSLHFLSSNFKIPSILHLETVGLQSHAGKSAALTIKEAIILPDIPFKGIVKHFQEALAFTDQSYTSIFLLFQERVTEQLTIGDRPLKVVTVVNREALFPADFISKQIGKTFVSAVTFLDSATTQITITLQEQIIPEHLWLQDSVTKLIVLFKTENLNLQETITKHIQILKEEALSLLDTLTKQIGPFIYERLQTEKVGLKDRVLVVAYTPWYNNPATFIQVCLYAFCIGLFAYYIYKQL